MKTSTTTTTFPRTSLAGIFVALAAVAVASLLFLTTWAHAKHVHLPIAIDLIVGGLVGGGVWAVKRRVLRLRSRGRNATVSRTRA